ncbi:VC0807 family protein [Streptomyces sp. NPDC059893]|uniref:VC0807 family protein n=1 Tax=Streptomyces sp. NPDC059893 TaxID=3346990 RepID=UPI0036489D33
MKKPQDDVASPEAPSGRRRPRVRRLFVVLMALASVAPLALYYLLRPAVHSDATALAISGAVPVGLALASAAVRRHSPWAALLIATGLGLAVAATVLSGGSSLPLKLYRPLATGVFGLVCVVSAAVHRPLLMVLVRVLAGRDERVRAALARTDDADRLQRRLTALTLIVGIVCLAEAGVTAALAFSLPTGAFLVTSRVIRWVVAGLGVAAALVYRASWAGRGRRPSAHSGGGAQGKQSWFGPKRYGIGWGPQAWQGRLITLAVVAAALAAKFAFGLHFLNG